MTGERRGHCGLCWVVVAGLLWGNVLPAAETVAFPGPEPGVGRAFVRNDDLVLANNVIECRWRVTEGRLRPVSVTNRLSAAVLALSESECFQLILKTGNIVNASDLTVVRGPLRETIGADLGSLRLGARNKGCQIRVVLTTPDERIKIEWRATLHDGSNYVRQHLHLAANEGTALEEIILVQLSSVEAKPAGTVDGSPVIVDDMFFAFEHPLSKLRMADPGQRGIRCSLPQTAPLKPGTDLHHSSVVGAVPAGQLRRGFLYYVERERAQPYRPFLHYNSWYDIGYGAEQIREPEARQVIDLFGRELIERRHVRMDSFVWDDGWDDPASLWRFHEGFPGGFASLQQRARQYEASIGAWLSPWGGYGKAKEERMKYGRQKGFETNRNGFSMAGARYYERFRDACLRMIRDYDLDYFKFDGISSGGVPTGADAEFAGDVQALLRLIDELRRAKGDLFVNVTTGTWSSPYWLWHADSTWRSGADWSTCGWGSKRQQQLTYRDAQTYENVVRRAPLYPLNSLMTQGVMFANHGLPKERDGLVEDIRAFFAGGTNCQELYITPSLLDARTWDVLAQAAAWSRANADVLVDTHWVGGNPEQGQVYGWASWSRRKGILALRNPTDEPRRIVLDIGQAFELPEGAARRYALVSPWQDDVAATESSLAAGDEHTFALKPFEVVVYDALPQ